MKSVRAVIYEPPARVNAWIRISTHFLLYITALPPINAPLLARLLPTRRCTHRFWLKYMYIYMFTALYRREV